MNLTENVRKKYKRNNYGEILEEHKFSFKIYKYIIFRIFF